MVSQQFKYRFMSVLSLQCFKSLVFCDFSVLNIGENYHLYETNQASILYYD